MTAVLQTEHLSVRYGGTVALDDVSIRTNAGELVGLIGPNGAGKTTFIDALSGFAPCTGKVSLNGAPVGSLPAHVRSRRGLGRTWQGAELFDELTVLENLQVAASDQKMRAQVSDIFRPKPSGHDAVSRAVELLDLEASLNKLPDELTQGQRKVVDVGRALAGGGAVLCLDEPAAGLDSEESLQLGARLRRLVEAGVSILLVDHDMGLVLSVCDRICVLDLGKLIAEGTPAEIRASRRVIDAYLGEDETEPGDRPTGNATKEVDR